MKIICLTGFLHRETKKKWRRIMRLTLFLMVGFLLSASANSYSQNIRLNIKLKDGTVTELMKVVEDQSEFVFLYKNEDLDLEKKVTVELQNATIQQVLDAGFAGQQVGWDVYDRQIVIHKADKLSLPGQAAQQRTVTGVVTDQSGQPLPGVTVVVAGTTTGTVTNADGEFSLSIPEGAEVLQFSFVGMKTQEVRVEGRTAFTVVMEEDVVGIEEVVAVGYGTMKRSDLTGAVASVKSEDINKTINNSFIDALAGRATGVRVISGEGTPGGDVSMRIRGGTSISASNEPLYVIDGYPVIGEQKSGEYFAGTTTNVLAGISPNDIESIEILKDASATAIYGSRGANGVVIITTKSGERGKVSISYEAYSGIKNLSKKLDLMDAYEYTKYRNLQDNTNFPDYESYKDSITSDWQDEVYRQAYVQDHSINITGGSESIKYNTSLGYFKNQGIISGSGFERYTGRVNLNGMINKKLSYTTVLSASHTKQEGAPTGGSDAAAAGVVVQALFYPPVVPLDSDDPVDIELSGGNNYNPILQLEGTKLQNTADRFMGNVSLDYMLSKGLTFKILAGTNVVNQKSSRYESTTTGRGSQYGGRAELVDISTRGWVNENTLTFKKKTGKHDFTLLGGYTLQSSRTERFGVVNTNFEIEDLGFNNIGAGTLPEIPSSGVSEWSLMSGLGRLNYVYDHRYLLTFSFRADGSSRFAKGQKWGYFPAAALAWRVSNENFLKDSKIISNLKFRVGYGENGNQEIGLYQALSSLSTNYYSFGKDNGTVSIGTDVSRVANPNLTWESTEQYNVGLDVGLFNNRITANMDAYYKKTRDLLLEVNLIPSSGISASALQNIGSLKNTGLEISFNSQNISQQNFKWETSFNIAFERNEILNLGTYDQIFIDVPRGNRIITNEVILKPGESIASFYGYKTDGIYKLSENPTEEEIALAGTRKIIDQNHDDVINDEDRTILGNALPAHYGGITNDFRYKGFGLSFFFTWSYGNKVYNANRVYLEEITTDGRNKSPKVLNAWTPENQNTDMVAIGKGDGSRLMDVYIEDGSFIRLQNLTLDYALPTSWLSKTPLSYARIYVTGQNLFTVTNYKGYNPESDTSNNPVAMGIDWAAYPLARIYTIGINVKF